MSRFGWAYVNSEMTGAVANGPDKSIQFASGSSQKISGSSNLTFDYTTNTLYLTGTLRADTLIVSASQILKSGSTIFGDDTADTHQFTGSIYNTTLVSGTIARFTAFTASNVLINNKLENGLEVTASGDYSHAEGLQTIADGNYSHAEGNNSTTLGLYSHAEGWNNITVGISSHAEGYGNVTSGAYSHAEGDETIARGVSSHSEGRQTIASGAYSHAEGEGTIAFKSAQTAVGTYNTSNNSTSLFVVGNGTNNATRSDILLVNPNDVIISGNLYISGTVSASSYLGITSGGTPGGLNTQVQFNSGSTFSGSSNLTFNYSTNNLSLTGALLMSGTSYISGVDYIDFDVSASAPSWKNGRVFWDNTDGALAVYNTEADITLQVGQENYVRARNQTGVLITNGSVVKINGAVGDRPSISLAQSMIQTASSTRNDIIGIATHDIEHGTDGFVTTTGMVRDLNTATYAAGDFLWVSSSAGAYTNIEPVSPYDKTLVGIVTRVNASNGTIFVTPQQPSHIHDMSDVTISSRQNGDLLVYNSGSQYWQNTKILSGSYTITGTLTAGAVSAASNIISTGGILSASTGVQTAGAITAATNITATGGTISASVGFQTAGTVTAASNITSTGGTLSASVGVQTGGTITSANNITSTGGTISASVGFQTAGTVTAASNITSTNGTISASIGFQTAGSITAANGLVVTGSSYVQALSSSGQIQATAFRGDGLNITGTMASNVIAAGNDWNVQFFDANTGYITGSNALKLSASSTPNLFVTTFSGSGIVKSSTVRSTNRTLNDGDYYLFFSSSSPLTATLGASVTGREVVISNYGTADVLITGSGIAGFITTAGSPVTSSIIGAAGARTLKFVYLSNNTRWMAV